MDINFTCSNEMAYDKIIGVASGNRRKTKKRIFCGMSVLAFWLCHSGMARIVENRIRLNIAKGVKQD